jgi:hypothetical protein
MNISGVIALWEFKALPDEPPPQQTQSYFKYFFIQQRLQRAFATTALTSASRPNFSIKAVTGIKEVWPHLHSKLMRLFVMVVSLVICPLCSIKAGNANGDETFLLNSESFGIRILMG